MEATPLPVKGADWSPAASYSAVQALPKVWEPWACCS